MTLDKDLEHEQDRVTDACQQGFIEAIQSPLQKCTWCGKTLNRAISVYIIVL